MLNILFLGDVVGDEGVEYLSRGGRLRKLRQKLKADLVIVNGENSAPGNGITPDSANALLDAGADVITGGTHTWKKKEVYSFLDDSEYMIRPLNYPSEAPGMGYVIADLGKCRVLVMNVAGNVYMEPVPSPIEAAEKVLTREKGKYDIALCDIHAEATSEKLCFARYFDGRMSCICGTHTHVPTADVCVLPGGTGYITDLGMCGSSNGILGVRSDCIIHKFTVRTPVKFEPAEGTPVLNGAFFEVDEKTGRCMKAERVTE